MSFRFGFGFSTPRFLSRQSFRLGTELVTNGTFDADLTGWTDADTGTGSSQWNAAGYMELTGVDVSNRANRNTSFTTIVGRTYQLTFDKVAGGTVSIQTVVSGGGTALDRFPQLALGKYMYTFIALATTSILSFNAFSAGSAGIDNVSVRIINP